MAFDFGYDGCDGSRRVTRNIGVLGQDVLRQRRTCCAWRETARPYDFDSRVQPCVQLPVGQKSYPSSHALISTLDACVLALVFPNKQLDFKDLANELSERRMKIGVHFPSDVHAGQGLGVAICMKLAQDSAFMSEIANVQKAL